MAYSHVRQCLSPFPIQLRVQGWRLLSECLEMESAELESLDPLNALCPGFGALPNMYLLQSEDADTAEIVQRWLSLYAPISHPATT